MAEGQKTPEELQAENKLLERKLHRMHYRYDRQNEKMEWIFAHPVKFLFQVIWHKYFKKDQKYDHEA